MTLAAIDKQLYSCIEQLSIAQKKSLLGFIKTVLPGGKEEIPYTIEEYNQELHEAEAEIARGESYTHEEAKEIFKKHLDGRK